jgi:hypothetical protein
MLIKLQLHPGEGNWCSIPFHCLPHPSPSSLSYSYKNSVVANLPLFMCVLCSLIHLWRKKWPV